MGLLMKYTMFEIIIITINRYLHQTNIYTTEELFERVKHADPSKAFIPIKRTLSFKCKTLV